jgi:hypothetical protein
MASLFVPGTWGGLGEGVNSAISHQPLHIPNRFVLVTNILLTCCGKMGRHFFPSIISREGVDGGLKMSDVFTNMLDLKYGNEPLASICHLPAPHTKSYLASLCDFEKTDLD